jgi:hypothetical protein
MFGCEFATKHPKKHPSYKPHRPIRYQIFGR